MNPPLDQSDRLLTAADVGIWARLYRIEGLYRMSMDQDYRDFKIMVHAQWDWCDVLACADINSGECHVRGTPQEPPQEWPALVTKWI